jgi:hypothetical protein
MQPNRMTCDASRLATVARWSDAGAAVAWRPLRYRALVACARPPSRSAPVHLRARVCRLTGMMYVDEVANRCTQMEVSTDSDRAIAGAVRCTCEPAQPTRDDNITITQGHTTQDNRDEMSVRGRWIDPFAGRRVRGC